jgi:hypothetical protein
MSVILVMSVCDEKSQLPVPSSQLPVIRRISSIRHTLNFQDRIKLAKTTESHLCAQIAQR